MTSLAVFETPHVPEGWEGHDVARIVDPLGKAIAWISPELAGACIGFCARRHIQDPWIRAVDSPSPSNPDEPGAFGCEVIWSDKTFPLTPARHCGSAWSLLMRDPTEARVSGIVNSDEYHICSKCEDGSLNISVSQTSAYSPRMQVGFRLHLGGVQRESLSPRRQTNMLAIHRSDSPAPTLVCNASKNLMPQIIFLDDISRGTRIDFAPFGDGAAARRDDAVLAELSLTIHFGDFASEGCDLDETHNA